jgi:hypothetical protein
VYQGVYSTFSNAAAAAEQLPQLTNTQAQGSSSQNDRGQQTSVGDVYNGVYSKISSSKTPSSGSRRLQMHQTPATQPQQPQQQQQQQGMKRRTPASSRHSRSRRHAALAGDVTPAANSRSTGWRPCTDFDYPTCVCRCATFAVCRVC